MSSRYLILASSLLLSGCASTDVLDIGSGWYSLTGRAHVNCPAGSREEAVEAANEYCDRLHKKPSISTFDDKVLPYQCTSSIVFRCDHD